MTYINNIYKKINKCRISGDKNLITVAKFPKMGLTGTFPKSKSEKIIKTPVEVVFSKKSKLLQLNTIIIQRYYMEKIMDIGQV